MSDEIRLTAAISIDPDVVLHLDPESLRDALSLELQGLVNDLLFQIEGRLEIERLTS